MPKKKSYFEVKSEFVSRGYKLLEECYVNNTTKMKFICPQHSNEILETTYKQLSRGEGCRFCGRERQAKLASESRRKYSFENIKSVFEANGCVVLTVESKEINSNSIIRYRCKCGNESKTSFKNFKKGSGMCKSCAMKNKRLKWSWEEVSKEFGKEGYKLLTKEIHSKKKLKYICPKGHHSEVGLSNFRNGNRCGKCANINKRNNYEDVKKLFEKYNCKLLTTEYRDSTFQKLDYICSCGNPHSIRYLAFQRGERCPQCSSISKGEKAILHFLEDREMENIYQYKFKECRNVKPLPFDFAVLNKDKSIKCVIEFDGCQHYRPIKQWGGDEYFKKIQENDQIKNIFCILNNIKLYRIPYKDLKNIETILEEILVKENNDYIEKYLKTAEDKLNEIGNRSIIVSDYGNGHEINENSELEAM